LPFGYLGFISGSERFPIFSQIYRGNQNEPQTLEEVLNRLEKDCGKAGNLFFKPTIVMDRGIAVQNNLNMLQERQYPYVVIERRQAEKEYREEFEQAKDQFTLLKTSTDNHVYLKKFSQ